MIGKDWREELAKYPKLLADFEIKLENSALIIVDMQYYDAHPDYGLGRIVGKQSPRVGEYFFPRLKIVVSNCARILSFFRKNKLKVFHATFGASLPDGSDMLPLRKMRDVEIEKQTGIKSTFTRGTFEHQILDELKPVSGELEINKTTRCSFTGTNLDHILRMAGIESTVIVGALTNVCVENTARSATDRGYKTILIDDATATFSQEMQVATMMSFALFFGRVMTTDELLKALSDKP
jgi:nicotinamidase-related amidase